MNYTCQLRCWNRLDIALLINLGSMLAVYSACSTRLRAEQSVYSSVHGLAKQGRRIILIDGICIERDAESFIPSWIVMAYRNLETSHGEQLN
jgi:hypothetical protein